MRARDVARGVGVVAVVAAVVVAAAYAGGAVLSTPSNVADAPDAAAYDTEQLLTDPVADDGSVAAPSDGESKTVVFDVSHGNAVSENEIQPFVDALVAAGHDVRFYAGSQSSFGGSQGASAFNETLRSADALVVVSPATAYTDAEIDGVAAFADAGGRVLLAADPPATTTTQSTISLPGLDSGSTASAAGQPAGLAARFDVTFGAGYLYDMAENGNNFQRVYASGSGDVGDGVERAVLLDATPLRTGPNASPVLSAEASLSETRDAGTYAVAARNGNVLAVGDTAPLTVGVASDGDNDAFASNVAAFLVSGDKEPGAPTSGQSGGGQSGTGQGGSSGGSTQPSPTARLAGA